MSDEKLAKVAKALFQTYDQNEAIELFSELVSEINKPNQVSIPTISPYYPTVVPGTEPNWWGKVICNSK